MSMSEGDFYADHGNASGGENAHEEPTAKENIEEVRQKAREDVYRRYMAGLGLTEAQLAGKQIADVGAGSLAGFGDRTRQLGIDCTVTSIDERAFTPTSIPQGKNRKIGGVKLKNVALAKELGQPEEPKFDYVLFKDSTPYRYIADNQDPHGDWFKKGDALSSAEFGKILEDLQDEISTALRWGAEHCALGGQAIYYPVFDATRVHFPKNTKDFKLWRDILDAELKNFSKNNPEFTAKIELVKEQNDTDYYRLVLTRQAKQK